MSVAARPYSPETLADRWGCSAEKVRLMYKSGELAGFRLGKLIRIPAAEVDRYECSTTDLASTEGDGPSSMEEDQVESVSRLARLTVASRRLALVKSGAGSTQPRASE